MSISQNLCALGWPRSPSFLLQEHDLPDDIAAVVWGSDHPVFLKWKSCHTGLVHLPGHSPPSSRAHNEVQCCKRSVLWAYAGFLWDFCQELVLDPHTSGFGLVGRSQLTGRLIEYVQFVYFSHKLVTTLGEGAVLLKRAGASHHSEPGSASCTNCFPPVTVNHSHMIGQPGGKGVRR